MLNNAVMLSWFKLTNIERNNVVQCCFNKVVQHWWSNNGCSRLLGAGGNMHWYKESYSLLSIYGRATLVNKLLRHRYHAVTTLLSRLNNSVDNIVRKVQLNIVHGWQHNILQDFALYISSTPTFDFYLNTCLRSTPRLFHNIPRLPN